MLATKQQNIDPNPVPTDVYRYHGCEQQALAGLLADYGLVLEEVDLAAPVPGSFWGEEEAGLIGERLLVRADTPVHSILHEACHYICMDQDRRNGLNTDAGGDYDEENAVCYLQVLLSACLPDMGQNRMFSDMDAWGYTFRLGSSRAWFKLDAEDARCWLIGHRLITPGQEPTGQLRGQAGQ